MRLKAEWAIDSDPIGARGMIVNYEIWAPYRLPQVEMFKLEGEEKIVITFLVLYSVQTDIHSKRSHCT